MFNPHHKFLNAYRSKTQDLDRLYEKNVRRFLGSRGRVNKSIQKTLRDTPELFGLYNNGITIVVSDLKTKSDGTTELVEPYVVNGCQTTKSIWEVCNQKLNSGGTGYNRDLEEWRQKAHEGVVITKIVKVGKDEREKLEPITRYTNSQNAVREKDFLALKKDFKVWETNMAEKYGVFLETQRGAWDAQCARQKQKPNLKPKFDSYANAFDLLKVYAAGWLGEAGNAWGKNAAFLPNGAVFKRIMDTISTNDPFGIDDLYAAYQLQLAANKLKFGRGAQASRRSTRYLFYMVVMELLKEVLIRIGVTPSSRNLTLALTRLFDAVDKQGIQYLLEDGDALIEVYLNKKSNHNVYIEPIFLGEYNSNLTNYLKADDVGKTEDISPHLHKLLSEYKITLGRGRIGQPSPLEVMRKIIEPL